MLKDAINEKVKFGGWLIVVGVLLWSNAIGDAMNILIGLLAITTHTHTTVQGLLVNSALNLILMVLMLVMFHRRKAVLVWWVVVYGVYAVLDECYIQYLNTIAHSSTPLVGKVIAVVLEALFMTCVLMYFFKSSRVKQTFVR